MILYQVFRDSLTPDFGEELEWDEARASNRTDSSVRVLILEAKY